MQFFRWPLSYPGGASTKNGTPKRNGIETSLSRQFRHLIRTPPVHDAANFCQVHLVRT